MTMIKKTGDFFDFFSEWRPKAPPSWIFKTSKY